MKKIAILLFSKCPQPGLVKTRLTTLKDGFFEPNQASDLYKAMLFDVYDCCVNAAAEAKEFVDVVSTNDEDKCIIDIVISSPGIEQCQKLEELFKKEYAGIEYPLNTSFIFDEGKSFDCHYNDAFNKAWDLGYDAIVSMGCDMPCLIQNTVVECLTSLYLNLCDGNVNLMVLSADQQMGVSIIGWNKNALLSHDGVFYNQDGLTVLPAYIQLAKKNNIPVYYVEPSFDIDTIQDLYHNCTMALAMEYAANFQVNITPPKRFLSCIKDLGLDDIRVMPNDLMDPRDQIDF